MAALFGVCVVAGVSLLVGGLLFNQQLLVERDNNLLAGLASSFRLRMRLKGG